MSFELEENCPVDFPFDYRALAEKVIAYCLKREAFPCEAEIALTLTDEEQIREINQQHRGIDSATDVLSFPLLAYERPGDFSFLSQKDGDDFNPDTGEAMLGDIVLCVDKVKQQAESYGHSQEREFAFLIVHSMLHLFGYDHIDEEDAAIMEPMQRAILEELRIGRE